jgi:hypothetical protein
MLAHVSTKRYHRVGEPLRDGSLTQAALDSSDEPLAKIKKVSMHAPSSEGSRANVSILTRRTIEKTIHVRRELL